MASFFSCAKYENWYIILIFSNPLTWKRKLCPQCVIKSPLEILAFLSRKYLFSSKRMNLILSWGKIIKCMMKPCDWFLHEYIYILFNTTYIYIEREWINYFTDVYWLPIKYRLFREYNRFSSKFQKAKHLIGSHFKEWMIEQQYWLFLLCILKK